MLGKRTAWYCDVSCMFEEDDTCINLACSMPQDHQHVVGYVIGEECIKVVSFFSSMQYVRFRRFASPLVALSFGDVFKVEAFIGVSVGVTFATFFRRNKFLHVIASHPIPQCRRNTNVRLAT